MTTKHISKMLNIVDDDSKAEQRQDVRTAYEIKKNYQDAQCLQLAAKED